MMETNSEPTQNQHTDDVFSQLSDTQWRFVTAMVENPTFSKKDAAKHIGITPDTVYRWDKTVDAAIETARANIHQAALGMRKQAVLKAIAVKIRLLDSDDENVRSKVATEIIEWELGKAAQRTELANADGKPFQTQQTNVNIAAESAHDASNILKQLAELGAIPSPTSTEDNHAETE